MERYRKLSVFSFFIAGLYLATGFFSLASGTASYVFENVLNEKSSDPSLPFYISTKAPKHTQPVNSFPVLELHTVNTIIPPQTEECCFVTYSGQTSLYRSFLTQPTQGRAPPSFLS